MYTQNCVHISFVVYKKKRKNQLLETKYMNNGVT